MWGGSQTPSQLPVSSSSYCAPGFSSRRIPTRKQWVNVQQTTFSGVKCRNHNNLLDFGYALLGICGSAVSTNLISKEMEFVSAYRRVVCQCLYIAMRIIGMGAHPLLSVSYFSTCSILCGVVSTIHSFAKKFK